MGDIRAWKSAALVALGMAADLAHETDTGFDILPTATTATVIHRRGRFKPNQRKQRKAARK